MGKILQRTTFVTTVLRGTFSFRPQEVTLKIWSKPVLNQIKFLFSERYTTDMLLLLLIYCPKCKNIVKIKLDNISTDYFQLLSNNLRKIQYS